MTVMTMQPSPDPRFVLTMADRMSIAARRSGMTGGEIADRIEVHRNTVNGWLSGARHPRSRDLKLFALATGYPASWLETGEVPPGGDDPTPLWAPWGSNPRPADYQVVLAPVRTIHPTFAPCEIREDEEIVA